MMYIGSRPFERIARILLGVIVLGSIWGLSEVALGGVLRVTGFPYRAGLLTGIGMAVMGIGLAIFRKPGLLVGVGLVSVGIKLLVVPILQVSVSCQANSCIGVMASAAALSAVAPLQPWRLRRNIPSYVVIGALAAVLSSVGFYFVGMRVAPCSYLLSFTPAGFVMKEGLVWAAFSASLLPLGYLMGVKAANSSFLTGKPAFYYLASMFTIVVCVGISSAVIISGL